MAREGLGNPEYLTIVRSPRIRVELDKWDFSTGKITETLDLTNYMQSYQFSKTLHNPSSQASLSVLPQFAEMHLLEKINPMDVVRIYEFDALKFQGYVRKIGYKGLITEDGKPQRAVTIGVNSFGNYLMDAKLGINLAILKEDFPIYAATEKLSKAIQDAGDDGLTFKEVVTLLTDAWFKYLESIVDSSTQEDYVKTYVDFSAGVTEDETAGFPKEVYLFTEEEEELSLWMVMNKLGEAPLNEFFFDEGPRRVHISGKDVTLTDAKTYLIVRPTPFDGTITDKIVETNRFQAMKGITIPRTHLLSVDLNKSIEDVYSVYVCAPPMFKYDDLELIATGYSEIDEDKIKKYLYRPCKQDLYYIRNYDIDSTQAEQKKKEIDTRSIDTVKTLKNWFLKNDEFLSGTISFMVPTDSNMDPRIGDKLSIEKINGDFYVEEITHTWSYGKALISSAGVTRGYDGLKPISLQDKLFRKGKHTL
jgi:hypothetical protein